MMMRPFRTQADKARRRALGDGLMRFADRHLRPCPEPWANTITSVTKDNLLCSEYE